MKEKNKLIFKFLFFATLVIALLNATARGFRPSFAFYEPAADDTAKIDSPKVKKDSLRFPIYDQTGEPYTDYHRPGSIDLKDPKNYNKSFDYLPDSNRYDFHEKLGSEFIRNPTYMTLDEYLKYKGAVDEDSYFQRRLDAMMSFNKTPELPQMYKEGLFDRIFGGSGITVKPQGNVDVTFGGNWQNIKNPTLVQRAQKYGVFDFDMQMNINLLATIGDKMKLQISNNTKATFDYQNMQKLDYSGKEDEMLKKIEAGNVSFPLKSNLISGVQSLFGLKSTLQFGKLWVTGVISQQKSQRKSVTVQGGAQAQQFSIKATNYEENKDFLLSQYFHDNYDKALKDFPVINSTVTLNRIEVWVTNRTGAVNGVRKVLCFMDMGEANPYEPFLSNPNSGIRAGLPDNRSNRLYTDLVQNPNGRLQSSATNSAISLGLTQGTDFEPTTARQLSPSEFSFNPQLGYIMLNSQMNSDDVLGVAFRYTYKGKVYQVGEFAEDLPPDTTNPKVLFLKLLKGTSSRPALPVWHLMMKNIYALGGVGVTKDNFTLNVLYQNPGGGELRYMPEGQLEGTPFISLLNLDRLNSQGEPHPDGVFDFVDGITINTQQGKIIFPELEPFGNDLSLATKGPDQIQLSKKYLFQVLYDSTKTVAIQSQQSDHFIIKGTFKSNSSSDIYLGGFNIPPGSVSVTAGGTKLTENTDYSIDYSLGRVKILNSGILNSGVPINIQYEDNSTFGFQQQNFMGARFDYYVNRNLTLGGTLMRLNERPFTQQVTYGEDPIKNTVIGLDANYQKEVPGLTRLLDKLPIYATTATSFLNTSLEVAGLLPNHPKQIDALDPEGSIYIDNFEGTTSSYDLKFPSIAWSMSSTPRGAVDKHGVTLFPEAAFDDELKYGINRARLAWYTIEPTLVDPGSSVPNYVKDDSNQHYIRLVQIPEVFPNQQTASLQGSLSTFDLAYYPREKGAYNFDNVNINNDNTLINPASRWGGIMRPIDNTDFEASNVEFIQFWVMDPFINNPNSNGGSLFLNLGDVSEDILKDSRLFFENGIPAPFDGTKLDTTAWGYVPKFEQQITRAFDNDVTTRNLQDVGYDGLPDSALAPGMLCERTKFLPYLNSLKSKLNPAAYAAVYSDPCNDNYKYYRGSQFDSSNNGNGSSILLRYKKYNNPQGNSPVTDPNAAYATSETTIPESEDINRDNTLNEAESYFQYRVDLHPNMSVGTNNIINIQNSSVKLPNGKIEQEKWYQFKIPIHNYDHVIGGISDFRSIRFMRLFMSGWQDSVIMRFASLELGRNQWRTYNYSLLAPGENVPQQNQGLTEFSVTSVSIEENGQRTPIPYVIPPGVSRQLTSVSSGQTIQLNEQALSLKACALQDGDARAVFKEVNLDMRQFTYLRMFIHAESQVGQQPINNADVDAIIRLGSDFTNNYYEYRMPLTITPPGVSALNTDAIWPASNEVDIVLQDLVNAKKQRDALNIPFNVPYYTTDAKGNTIVVVGSPNIGGAKNIMLGLMNPKKTNRTPGDDGQPKCIEAWFDELRMAGMNDHASYAAAGKMNVQLADLGNYNLSGSWHSAGYGTIDQKINQRSQDDYYQYNTSTNLSLGKLLPKTWGVQLPLYVGYTQNVSTPKYDPYNQDYLLTDELNAAKSAKKRDSINSVAQDFTSIASVNLTNVRITGNTANAAKKFRTPWSIKNFDFSVSYNNQFKHNPTVSEDLLTTTKLGVGYAYNLKIKPIEPFKSIIKSKSKWFGLIKDFNITPVPTTYTMRNDLNRVVQQTQIRNINDGSGYQIPTTFYKSFNWTRVYTVRWELTKSLSCDYTATNISRVDEPYGRINTKQKEDSLWQRILTFGHNTSYRQTFNSSYNVPLSKLPITDWMTCRLSYAANYSWTGAAPVAYDLGNTIGNTQTKTIVGDLNMSTLYNKWRWMRALNTKTSAQNQTGIKQAGNINDKPGAKSGAMGNNKSPAPVLPGGNGNTDPGGGNGGNQGNSNANGGGGASGGGNAGGGNGNGTGGNSGNTGGGNNASGANGGNNVAGGKGGNENNATGTQTGNNTTGGGNNKGNNNTATSSNLKVLFPNINLSTLSNTQLDSLVEIMDSVDDAKARAEKALAKAKRKAARKARRAKLPELNGLERFAGHILTSLTHVTVNYSQTAGTTLPGYMDSTKIMGINTSNMQPGYDFVYGYQPNAAWLAKMANDGKLSRDSLFNAQFQQTFSTNLSGTATFQPIKEIKLDLTLTKTFSKSHSELFADTGSGVFNHFNPYETGSFNISFLSLHSMFPNSGVNSAIYNLFLSNRQIISKRLGASNPYTNGLPDPTNPSYAKGYTEFSQDVLIPSFIAAYSGNNAATAPLIDYTHNTVSNNPFKYFIPTPNWLFTYNGLNKLPFFSDIFSSFIIKNGYTGTMNMNGFTSNLMFTDLYGLGFPSFIDSNSHNYVPYFQVPNVTISQQLNPLIGFDAAFKNHLTAKFEIKKSKMESLSLIDYQVSENTSTEYVIGMGFRKKGIKLPFPVAGVRKLKNELIAKIDIGFRDDKNSNTFLANNVSVVSRGQQVITIRPSVDYSVNQKLTLHFFYDRSQSIPYVSNAYPTTTAKGGVTLRFIFAQ